MRTSSFFGGGFFLSVCLSYLAHRTADSVTNPPTTQTAREFAPLIHLLRAIYLYSSPSFSYGYAIATLAQLLIQQNHKITLKSFSVRLMSQIILFY